MTHQKIVYIKKDGTKVEREYMYDYRYYKFKSKTLLYSDGNANIPAIKEMFESLPLKAEKKIAARILKEYCDKKQKLTMYKLRELLQKELLVDLFEAYEETHCQKNDNESEKDMLN